MWFAGFLTAQHSGISAVESDLEDPALKSTESIMLHKAKLAMECSLAEVKIEVYSTGPLLQSSSLQIHGLTLDQVIIMKPTML